MPLRLRKLVGSLALILFVVVYMILAMVVTARLLPQQIWIVQAAGYVFAGLIWVLPAGLIIRWMAVKG